MIKVKNVEAMRLMNPEVDAVFRDKDAKFPVAAGHLLMVGIEKIRKESTQLAKDRDTIIREFAIIDPKTKAISYANPEKELACQNKLVELMGITREINARKVKVTDSFPDLPGTVIHALRPLLDFGDEPSA